MSLFDTMSRWLLAAPAPVADYPFVASDVALYQRTVHGGPGVLDAQTWDDLLLAPYSARLAAGTSILGQQELHRRLHADGRDADTAASAVQVRTLLSDPARRQRLQAACEGLRAADREVSETLFGAPLPPVPRWARYLGWLPVAFLLSAVLALVSGWMPLWCVVLGLWLALMWVQVRFHNAAEEWQRIQRTLSQMLRAHSLLARLDDPLTMALRDDAAAAGKINRRISRSPLAGLAGVREYGDWLWLLNIRHYFASREVVRSNLDLLQASFQRVAVLEADLALARHLAAAPRYCWATQGGELSLEQAVHPLLAAPEPLTLALGEGGAFVSGQNGIGKSTLLRTLGLNLIVARAFGFCYADAAVTSCLPVYSSMQNEDALAGGESLYVAELRRARELLALSERAPAIFLIDEIFRGTNHLESVSAAAAVLDTLAAAGRVVVSSHNLVLAALLAKRLAPVCVQRIDGQLLVAAGVLTETNGIALLKGMDASGLLSVKAGRVYDWLSAYLAHPTDCNAVLD